MISRNTVYSKTLSFFYPPLCLHCQKKTEDHRHLLCTLCLEQLSLLEAYSRCSYCFKSIEGVSICKECREAPIVIKAQAETCESIGPSQTILRSYRKGSPLLASVIGSLMALQLLKLNWPLPDYIVPLSLPLYQRMGMGADCNKLLSYEVGKVLGCPVLIALKCAFNFSFLSDAAADKLRFTLREQPITDKTLLLITDRNDPDLIRRASHVLKEGFPKQIYSLSFCAGSGLR